MFNENHKFWAWLKAHRTPVLITASIIVIFLCSIGMVIRGGWIHCDDIQFHLVRIMGITRGLQGGQFPVKYYPNFYFGAGYVSSLLYPDLFLYIPALMVLCGVPLVWAYWIFIDLIQICIYIAMWSLAKKIFKSNFWAVVCATIFVLSQYIYVDLFMRGAVGESLSIIFTVLLFNGLYNLVKEDFSKPLILSFALLGMLYSHFTTLIIGCVCVVIVVLINAKKLFTQKSFYIKASIAFAVFILLGAYQLFGFLELYFADTYYISRPWAIITNYAYSLDLIFDGYRYGLGLLMLIPFVLRCFVRKDETNLAEIKIINRLLIVGGCMVLLISAAFPWRLFQDSLSFLQFPWRLNTIITMILCIALIYEFKNLRYQAIISSVFVALVVIYCPLFYNLSILYTSGHNFRDYDTTERVNWPLEWVPVAVIDHFKWISDPRQLTNNRFEDIAYDQVANTTTIHFDATADAEYYNTPIIYYKGYTATITLEDGQKRTLKVYPQDEGRARIETNGLVGKVELTYTGTIVQTLGWVISCLSLLGLGGYAIYMTVRKHRQKSKTANI